MYVYMRFKQQIFSNSQLKCTRALGILKFFFRQADSQTESLILKLQMEMECARGERDRKCGPRELKREIVFNCMLFFKPQVTVTRTFKNDTGIYW